MSELCIKNGFKVNPAASNGTLLTHGIDTQIPLLSAWKAVASQKNSGGQLQGISISSSWDGVVLICKAGGTVHPVPNTQDGSVPMATAARDCKAPGAEGELAPCKAM